MTFAPCGLSSVNLRLGLDEVVTERRGSRDVFIVLHSAVGTVEPLKRNFQVALILLILLLLLLFGGGAFVLTSNLLVVIVIVLVVLALAGYGGRSRWSR